MRIYSSIQTKTDNQTVRESVSRQRGLQNVRTVVAVLWISAAVCIPRASGQMVTFHGDSTRQGQVSETLLTRTNVNSTHFGKLFSYSVDGQVVAQPLYVPNVTVPGLGKHNVVYVATQHDSVYAFDADSASGGLPLWQVSFINTAAGVTTVPIAEQLCPGTGFTEMGILGTPVIDTATHTLYVSVKTREVAGSTVSYFHRVHALDITTGAEKFNGPVVVSASFIAPNGAPINFTSLPQCQRPGLLLQSGILYVAYGSNGCDLRAHGWVFAFDAGATSGTLQQLAYFNTSPDETYGSSIWQSGTGLAADSDGNIFFSTANGQLTPDTGDFGDTFMKINFNGTVFNWLDYFSPYDQANMQTKDLDLGSGGVILLPDQSGAHPHLMVGAGKTGTIYLVDRDNMGGFNPNDDSLIVQSLPGAIGPFFSSPVYWNNTVYFLGYNDAIKGFALSGGMLSPTPSVISKKIPVIGIPSISANGQNNGILWIVRNPTSPMLSAFNATDLTELYNSTMAVDRDTLSATAHFITPTIARGKVYVATQTQLIAYGLFPFLSVAGGNAQVGTAGSPLPGALSLRAVNSQGVGVPGVSVTFSDANRGGSFGNATAITDSTGTAVTSYTAPIKMGNVTITASAGGYVNTTFALSVHAAAPSTISILSGSAQTGTVATTLPAPIVVRVHDAYNNSNAGIPVSFSDGGVGGIFSTNPVTTGATGTASVSYTLPTAARSITLQATYSTIAVNIGVKSVAGPAAHQSIVAGNNQTAHPSSPLARPLAVKVVDQFGNPVAGLSVSFSDNGAGGSFSSPTAITTGSGQASVTYTTPSQTGLVGITASVSNITAVTFSEKVQ